MSGNIWIGSDILSDHFRKVIIPLVKLDGAIAKTKHKFLFKEYGTEP